MVTVPEVPFKRLVRDILCLFVSGQGWVGMSRCQASLYWEYLDFLRLGESEHVGLVVGGG
jgi:hypothetical protein